MKKITLMLFVFMAHLIHSQSVVWEDNFDDQDISDWTLLDEDGDGQTFFSYFPTGQPSPMLASASWNNDPLTPDNYAISSAIDVTGYYNLELNYMVAGQDPEWAAENYTVYISTGNTITDFMNTAISVSFTENLGDDPNAAGVLVPRSVDISALDGATTLYVAFRHHNVSDQFILDIDDVAIVAETLHTDEFAENETYKITCKDRTVILSNLEGEIRYSIYSLTGQQIIIGNTSLPSQNVDVSGLSAGVYIVEINDVANNATVRQKIIIE